MSSLLEESDSCGGGGFCARVALGFGAGFGGGVSALAFGGMPLRLGCGASVCCLCWDSVPKDDTGGSGTCSCCTMGSGGVSSTTGLALGSQ